MNPPSIKTLLNERELVVGLMVQQVCTTWIAKLFADAGADFTFVESEHSSFNGAQLGDLILGSRLSGLPVVAKCPYVDRGSITKLLDAGVTGIQLPMAESAAQLAEVVRYVKFPPKGERSASPGNGNTNFEPVDCATWVEEANEETTVLAHIESRAGVDHVDEILEVPGVDIMFVGIMDLSISLGHPVAYEHPDFVKAMDKLIGSAKAHGKVAGMYAPTYEVAEPFIKRGVRFVETAGDVGFIANGACAHMKCFPGHGPRITGGQAHV